MEVLTALSNKSYPSKWQITYQGKPYMSVYGKKKAYDLCIRLSRCVNGLQVEAAPRRGKKQVHKDKREYHRQWRSKNKEKVREYNKRSYQKRKQKMIWEQLSEKEELLNVENMSAKQPKAYEAYLRWKKAELPEWMKDELVSMNDEQIAEQFGSHLEFGTGGMRAEIGVGTNRMNHFTVRRATQGLADYLLYKDKRLAERGVVIAYDTRRFSKQFAEEAALVLANNGIKAFVFCNYTPTPLLSFAVRRLHAAAGIVITASHNPASYNGYKVYGEDGAQLTPNVAEAVMDAVNKTSDELSIQAMDADKAKQSGLYRLIEQEIYEPYYHCLQSLTYHPEIIAREGKSMKIVYTPLHGSGMVPVVEALTRAGFQHVIPVTEQQQPHEQFPTVRTPNPEETQALEMAVQLAAKAGAELVLATDPDADRVGAAVRTRDGSYINLTGNEIGALLMNYILSQLEEAGRLPHNGVVLKTIVTSELGRSIASSYGVKTIETLTGFKYIGEQMNLLEQSGELRFLFGYEESYGYLIGDFVRDKDAVQACLMISEMTAYYRAQGKTLLDVLQELFHKFGFYREDQHSITFEGLEGMARMNALMSEMRNHSAPNSEENRVSWVRDFLKGTEYHLSSNMLRSTGLPKSNVLHYTFRDTSWFAVRPSGTEPKLKIYFSAVGRSSEAADERIHTLKKSVIEWMDSIMNDHKGYAAAT